MEAVAVKHAEAAAIIAVAAAGTGSGACFTAQCNSWDCKQSHCHGLVRQRACARRGVVAAGATAGAPAVVHSHAAAALPSRRHDKGIQYLRRR